MLEPLYKGEWKESGAMLIKSMKFTDKFDKLPPLELPRVEPEIQIEVPVEP